jgi:hypothetical protein
MQRCKESDSFLIPVLKAKFLVLYSCFSSPVMSSLRTGPLRRRTRVFPHCPHILLKNVDFTIFESRHRHSGLPGSMSDIEETVKEHIC